MQKPLKPVALIVLDGWGYREEKENNALIPENAPTFFKMWNKYPHSLLEASGEAIGLPKGQIGTSEIGHMTIGAGRPLDTDLVCISKAFETGEFARNHEFIAMADHVKKHGSTLHVMGLVSPGGVHSHQDHLYNLIKVAKEHGVNKIAIHAFTDGRDVAPRSASRYLQELEQVLEKLQIGRIASVSGRYFAMDRDNNWERIKKVEKMLFHGDATSFSGKASALLAEMHSRGFVDEHVEPAIILDDSGKPTRIEKNDAVFFFNFRPDRARQMSRIMTEQKHAPNIFFLTMTEYDTTLTCRAVFPPTVRTITLAEAISDAGLRQAHVAETEKYAHATYFLNGKIEKPHTGEEFVLVESRKDVPTHDLAPEMKAKEITDAALLQVHKGVNFIFINYANVDMVGHTANVDAVIQSVTILDKELNRFIEGLLKAGGVALITSDHGNAEVNVDAESGEKHTAHTENPVPAIITMAGLTLREKGTLADVAPTILELLNVQKPTSMSGVSLIG